MVLSVCSNPDLLSVMLIVNKLIKLLFIVGPVLVIVISSIDLIKAVIASNQEMIAKQKQVIPKRFLAAIIVFFVPTVLDLTMNLVDNSFEYNSCFTNATEENVKAAYINRADNLVATAETSLNRIDYNDASLAVSKLEEGTTKDNYKTRLEAVLKTIEDKDKNAAIVSGAVSGTKKVVSSSGNLNVVGSYSSTGNGSCKAGIEINTEPDPSAAINCWPKLVSKSDFVFPKDPKTRLPLGSWPKNYASIPTQLSNYNTYAGTFIFPITPTSGTYHFVYDHDGIDFMAPFGTPIYAPADGTLMYSTWGHTRNKGGDETSYSVSIKLNKNVTVQGTTISTIFLTHMSGIIYRCDSTSSCNRSVKKGELIGFSGNAAGSSTSVGWAPHLHMTLYGPSGYDNGLYTPKIEALYGIPTHSSGYKIQAGG